jgi:hypothetical protein
MGDANFVECILSYREFRNHLGVGHFYSASEPGRGGLKSMAVTAKPL